MRVVIGAGYTGGHMCLAESIIEHLHDLDDPIEIYRDFSEICTRLA